MYDHKIMISLIQSISGSHNLDLEPGSTDSDTLLQKSKLVHFKTLELGFIFKIYFLVAEDRFISYCNQQLIRES